MQWGKFKKNEWIKMNLKQNPQSEDWGGGEEWRLKQLQAKD